MSRRTPTIGRIAYAHAPGGFALVAVLWVTAILAAIATGYATMARLQGQEALHGLTAAKQTYLLQSALAKGKHELRKYTLNRHLLARKDELESIGQKTLGLWWPRHEAYRIRLEDMNMAVRLVGDTGKLDVNSLDYARWVTLLAACGLEDSAEITAVANSIVDWTDEDTNFSIGGAENDYYQGLDKPYLCKDGPMESIEELLLVKGVTPELYHGTDERPGLSDLLDVGGSQDKLDINSASPRAFLMIQGLSPETIAELETIRNAEPITRLADLADVLPAESMAILRQHFDIVPPQTVFLEAARILSDDRLGALVRRASSS
ncbi:type II secretory pathway, component PulK [Desulfocurvibacter africanus PCS]|uniref:Type II secretory pathway, component PulK n=1 Tax=Desulfocurvibacter africanus PCS TaxID=1262666 RepID=M5PXR5_DESAF|nr:type II secretion system protein GspK [Desulfocurvibacter africanus]EMG39092.1 type II secretory pathway, component PulK [Desulfocurvibacter africanus PCS]